MTDDTVIWITGALLLTVAGLSVLAACAARLARALRALASETARVRRMVDAAHGAGRRRPAEPADAPHR